MRKINTSDFRRATRLTPRAVNRQIVLNLIREHQPISRAELARRMGVHRGAMTGLVADLVDTGAVYEEKRAAPVVRGRRPTLLYVRTRDRFAAAVDVRPRRTTLALADYGGRVLLRDEFDTPASPPALVDEVARRIGVLRAASPHEALGGECHGVGVVVPGMVDRRTSRVLYAPRLGWRDVDLRTALGERLGLKVRVESAPIACALARLWLSPEQANVRSFAYVSVSEGVGVGLVLKGEVVRGQAHTAGEFGHVSFDPNGPECVCGQRGCWEALAGNGATVTRYADAMLRKRLGGGVKPAWRRELAPTVEEVIHRAASGEAEAVDALTETGRQIGRGLAAVVSAFNPGRIFVGGEVTAAWELIGGTIRSALAAGTLTDAGRETPVIPDRNPAEYRLLGAVALIAAPSFAAPKVG